MHTGILDSDGVDELIKEAGHTTEPLENSDTLSADPEGEQLHQERYRNIRGGQMAEKGNLL